MENNTKTLLIEENIVASMLKSINALQQQKTFCETYHTQGSSKEEMTGEKSKAHIVSSRKDFESQLMSPPFATDNQTLIKETRQNRQYRFMMSMLGIEVIQ